jgi:GT2 family glycosyltransferase/glycosyltransferase involved in cell wall biosynthesis
VSAGRNAGYAAAINIGLSTAAPGPVMILNPDVSLHPGAALRLLEALEQGDTGIAVPRLLDLDGSTSWSLRREPTVGRAWADAVLGGGRASRWGLGGTVASPAAYEHDHEVDWATGAAMAISADCRTTVGAWDESFFLYSEEVDFCRRARRAGFGVRYVHDALVSHDGGEYDSNPTLWRILMGNRVRDFGRHHRRPARTAYRTALLAGELIRSVGPSGKAHRAGAMAVLAPAQQPGPPATAQPGFVWFAAQDWWYHNQAHSDFQLMREVSRTRPVLVVNSLGLRLPTPGTSTHAARRIARKLRSTAKLVRRPVPDLPGFHVMTPVLLPLYGDNAGARVNAWLVRQQVQLVSRWVGVGDAPHVGVTIPTAWPVARRMKRASLLFNRSDLHSAFPEANGAWVAGLEESLLRSSDRVLYVSHELMRRDRALVGDRGVFLDHGVDVEHFTPDGDVDPDVASLPRPRIGFFGGLDDYVVDLDLLRATAEENPDASIVLIGDATCPMDVLTKLPNVHWLGHRSYSSIPALGRGFDVALMPWLDNEWIRFANPIKLKEYLALGLPVVTTDYPEVEDYRDRVMVATDRTQFTRLVRDAAEGPCDPRALRESVLSSSWSARAGSLASVADRVGGA